MIDLTPQEIGFLALALGALCAFLALATFGEPQAPRLPDRSEDRTHRTEKT